LSAKNNLSEPSADQEGHVYADDGPPHYMTTELHDGNERFSTQSNAIFMLHSLAQDWSTKGDTVLVVRADTHEAVFRYEAGKGLQEGWKENDPKKAVRRKEARQAGEKIITHNA
jgi:hypothetical protein